MKEFTWILIAQIQDFHFDCNRTKVIIALLMICLNRFVKRFYTFTVHHNKYVIIIKKFCCGTLQLL